MEEHRAAVSAKDTVSGELNKAPKAWLSQNSRCKKTAGPAMPEEVHVKSEVWVVWKSSGFELLMLLESVLLSRSRSL